MTSIKTYTAIFGVLMLLSTTQAAFEFVGILEEAYWPALGVILVLSTFKALGVAGYYMHLREEPRSISYVALGGLLCVLALTAGAGYSIL